MAYFPGCQRTPVSIIGPIKPSYPGPSHAETLKYPLHHVTMTAHGGVGQLYHWVLWSGLITDQQGISLPCSALRVVEAAAAGHGALGKLSSLGEALAEEADAHATHALKACEGCLGRRACGMEALPAGAPAGPCIRAGSCRKRNGLLALSAYVSSADAGPCAQVYLLWMSLGGGCLDPLLKLTCKFSPLCCWLCCVIWHTAWTALSPGNDLHRWALWARSGKSQLGCLHGSQSLAGQLPDSRYFVCPRHT